MRLTKGFTLVEILVASLLGTFLLLAAVGFFQSQLQMTQNLHRSLVAQQHVQQIFLRLARSIRQVQLPLGPGHVLGGPNQLQVGYWAGNKTVNCFGTLVLPGTFIEESFELFGDNLRCLSVYIDVNGLSKTDHQPLMHSVARFDVNVLRLQSDECADAVDVFIAYKVGDRALEKAKRILFPKCLQGAA